MTIRIGGGRSGVGASWVVRGWRCSVRNRMSFVQCGHWSFARPNMPQVRFAPSAIRDLERLREFLRPKSPITAKLRAVRLEQL